MPELHLTLYSSSFCGACNSTRATVERVAELVGERLDWREVNVADAPDESEASGIVTTPTVVITGADGSERMRASGVPTTPQLLAAIAAALP
ncbi:thioredoxin domain-containing protein [Herbiconiux sp. KACC 21604]|uniref:thioredoxin domain-containing protein n=1 Tax=unclassified Herbiconiux TaxID=2618217 RepID=UPI001490CEFE|nr:thioredoxin domain-containing protein [Herbiconiux sp. SALV-R1]QJU55013.1 thioredoxin [Herbiconiux sp. SALV-R1]WPO86148.1 thioredoxin domain-containing protein [Herbiconiux sp. KACC 21604]